MKKSSKSNVVLLSGAELFEAAINNAVAMINHTAGVSPSKDKIVTIKIDQISALV